MPPSPPSIVMKSTPRSPDCIAIGKVVPKREVTHSRLDSDGQAGGGCEHLDPVEHAVDVEELCVPRWADAVLPLRHPAGLSDLRRHLRCRQHSPEPRFGALAELYLEGTDGSALNQLLKLLEAEPSVFVSTAEVRRTDLEDELTALAVVRRHAAFPGVLQASGELSAAVERLDGVS